MSRAVCLPKVYHHACTITTRIEESLGTEASPCFKKCGNSATFLPVICHCRVDFVSKDVYRALLRLMEGWCLHRESYVCTRMFRPPLGNPNAIYSLYVGLKCSFGYISGA